MEDITQVLEEVNASVVYKKVRDLEVNQRFEIKSMDIVKTPYGKRICVKCPDFQITLPESWTEKLKPQTISKINQSKVYIVYKGTISLPNGKTKHEIVLVN